MADSASNLEVEEFRFAGDKYRVEEWKSRRGATVINLSTDERAFDLWPPGSHEKYGSKLMVGLTAQLLRKSSEGLSRLRSLNGPEAEKVYDESGG